MKSIDQYEWVSFYEELAEKLLEFKNKRNELVELIPTIFDKASKILGTKIKIPKIDQKDGRQVIIDIDPFTFFAFFNKDINDRTRNAILGAISELFHLKSKVPISFKGVPYIMPLNAAFFRFYDDNRDDNDINILWALFESALQLNKVHFMETEDAFCEKFKLACEIKQNGISKITIGLSWIVPNSFICLCKPTIDYLYNPNNLPEEAFLFLGIPKKEIRKLTGRDLILVSNTLLEFFDTYDGYVKCFPDLNETAYNQAHPIGNEDESSVVSENNERQAYTPIINYLDSIYLDSNQKDKLKQLIVHYKNLILQGPSGVGKTYIAKRLAYSIVGSKDENRVMTLQFHQSYSYEDFVEGYRPNGEHFELKDGPFKTFCDKARNDAGNSYFLIIDEINRGNLSKIFGELFMLIENDKREEEHFKLLYSGQDFSVPKNLFIIGTMNTADRSLAMLDYALRRRFVFYDIKPAFESEGFKEIIGNNLKFKALIDKIKELNNEISSDDSLGEGFCIGHSYFCKEGCEHNLSNIIKFEIIPLIKEYWFDNKSNREKWVKELEDIIK